MAAGGVAAVQAAHAAEPGRELNDDATLAAGPGAAVHTSEDLGRFLARVRQDHGLTQEELAEDLGVSRRYVSEIENGKPGLYTERLFQMLRLLRVRLRAEQVG